MDLNNSPGRIELYLSDGFQNGIMDNPGVDHQSGNFLSQLRENQMVTISQISALVIRPEVVASQKRNIVRQTVATKS